MKKNIFIAWVLCLTPSVWGTLTTYTVNVPGDTNLPYGSFSGSAGDLRGCLFQINKTGSANDYQIVFDPSITSVSLGGILPPVGLNGLPTSITIDGTLTADTNVEINGGSTHPGFFAYLPNPITIKNIEIADTVSQGGHGSGGALGAGGAIFVGQYADVTLENVSITGAEASGGNGAFGRSGNYANGGGGMCNGHGGASSVYYGGGGGGFGGVGGEAHSNAAGGGGGLSPYGGALSGSATGNGGAAANNGYAGGGLPGYFGGNSFSHDGGAYGGGGAGGTYSISNSTGAGGGLNGTDSGSRGGNGGPFGGGGGGSTYGEGGGNGGVYGGGGAEGANRTGGSGQTLGGGGGGAYYTNGNGGNGAFGGGGGGGANGGSGGVGGGNGSSSGGGGGAGFGGGVFVMDGGSLTIQGAFSVSGCSVAAGTGGTANSGNGTSAGSGLFFQANGGSVSCTLSASEGETITLSSDIADDNLLNVPSGSTYTPGDSSSHLSLIIGGTGTTALSSGAIAAHTGSTTVSGPFQVNGTISYSDVIVDTGGVLSGTGTLSQTLSVMSGGAVAPGNSIGTLASGSTTFNASSLFTVEIDDTGASSLLDVTGTVTIDEGANLYVQVDAGSYTATTYTILTSTEGITGGNLFTIGSSDPSKKFSLTADTYALYLELLQSGPTLLPTAGLSGNALSLVNYLNTLLSYEPLAPLFDELSELSPGAYFAALEQISPARAAFNRYAINNTTFLMSDVISSHLNETRVLQYSYFTSVSVARLMAGPPQPVVEREQNKMSLWLAPFGNWAHQNSQSQCPSFNYSSGGVLIGYDARASKSFLLGGALGYAAINLHDSYKMGSQHINDGVLSLYGSYIGPNLYVDAICWGGYYYSKESRNINFSTTHATAKGSTHGYFVDPHLAIGYDIYPGEMISWGAYAEADWVFNFQKAFSEKGAGILNMYQKKQNGSMLQTEVGINCSQIYSLAQSGEFVATASLAYVNKQAFGSGKTKAAIVGAPGGFFTTETLTKNQSLCSPAIELFYQSPSYFFAALLYEGQLGSGYRANELIGKLGWTF